MRRSLGRALAGLLVVAACAMPVAAKVVVHPVEAIEAARRLDASAFTKAYPGIDVTGAMPDAEGWYLRYRHENLVMLFGPMADRAAAIEPFGSLRRLREELIAKRPSLATSSIDLVEFRFDQALAGLSGDGQPGPEGRQDAERTEDASSAADGSTANRPGTNSGTTASPGAEGPEGSRTSRQQPRTGAGDDARRPSTAGTGSSSPSSPGTASPAGGDPGAPGAPATPAPSGGFWTLVRRIFGFG